MAIKIETPKGKKWPWKTRVIIFTPTTGLVRMEWVAGRYGQVIPCNWGFLEMHQFVSSYCPIEYSLADAQNMLAKKIMEEDIEWTIFVEQDNVIPPDLFMRFNQYMLSKKYPVVSGIYFTKSVPPEPILYRGRGNSYFDKWKLGDKVMTDGVPFGCLLMHNSLIRAAWEESEEYQINGETVRRIFKQPERIWWDEKKGKKEASTGTTDLEWCSRIMRDKLLEKAGWPKFQKMKHPFLVDTNIFVWHIDNNGIKWPVHVPVQYKPPKNYKGKLIK